MRGFFLLSIACSCFFVQMESKLVPLEVEVLKTYDPHSDGVVSKSYTFKPKTLPKPGYVNLRLIALNGFTHEETLKIDEDATLRDPKSNQLYDVVLSSYGYGEPVIISARPCEKSGKLKKDEDEAYQILFHNPLVVTDSLGHRVEIQGLYADGKLFRILVTGFEPSEEITFISESGSGMFKKTFKIADGETIIEYNPAVIGMKEGPFRVTFYNDRTPPLTIQHYWGKIAYTTMRDYPSLKKKFPTFNFNKPPTL